MAEPKQKVLKLDKPIVLFDLETTGVSVTNDRIVQFAAIKIHPDGTKEEKEKIINPLMPIPAGASEVHGITDMMVKEAPTFKQISKGFYAWIQGCDLAGYNSDNFDIPILIEEFYRADIEVDFSECNFIDVLKIERKVNSHTLGNTYQRYTGQPLKDAHDALIDVRATLKVFEEQLETHPELPEGIEAIVNFCQGDNPPFDYAGKMYLKDGEAYWAFGKHKDKLVRQTASYAKWVLNSEFPSETKRRIREVLGNL